MVWLTLNSLVIGFTWWFEKDRIFAHLDIFIYFNNYWDSIFSMTFCFALLMTTCQWLLNLLTFLIKKILNLVLILKPIGLNLKTFSSWSKTFTLIKLNKTISNWPNLTWTWTSTSNFPPRPLLLLRTKIRMACSLMINLPPFSVITITIKLLLWIDSSTSNSELELKCNGTKFFHQIINSKCKRN